MGGQDGGDEHVIQITDIAERQRRAEELEHSLPFSRRVIQLLPDYAPPQLWMSAVYPASHRSTAKVKAFLDFICKRFPSEPAWDRMIPHLPH